MFSHSIGGCVLKSRCGQCMLPLKLWVESFLVSSYLMVLAINPWHSVVCSCITTILASVVACVVCLGVCLHMVFLNRQQSYQTRTHLSDLTLILLHLQALFPNRVTLTGTKDYNMFLCFVLFQWEGVQPIKVELEYKLNSIFKGFVLKPWIYT